MGFSNSIKEFRDILAWQEAHRLMLMIYKETKSFPKEELYSLTDQLKRASISVTSNIAEGIGRFSYKEKVKFYYLAQGSLYELLSQVIAAKDLGFINENLFFMIENQAIQSIKLLKGLIKSSKTKI